MAMPKASTGVKPATTAKALSRCEDCLPNIAIEGREHRVDHWPPRSWCDECNEGFGFERPHASVGAEYALVSMDYAFLTKMGLVVKEGDECWNDPDTLKMLIMKDTLSKSVFAHAVP